MNEVVHRVVFQSNIQDVKRILHFFITKDGELDFNKLIPMPNTVYGSQAEHFDGDYFIVTDELLDEYGEDNIFNKWCENNWGCSHNAYGTTFTESNQTLTFSTMGGSGLLLLRKLKELHPSLKFNIRMESTLHGVSHVNLTDLNVKVDVTH